MAKLRFLHLPLRFLGRLAIAAAWVFAVALIIWNLARLHPGDHWSLVRLGNYFAPWLFMALAPVLVVALLARRPWLVRILALLTLIFAVRYWPLLIPRPPLLRAESSASELRVMTFNVNYANRSAPAISSLIRAESPDVIAFQELTGRLAIPLRNELRAEYPFFQHSYSQGLTAIMSRYPLTVQPVPRAISHTQRAVVETPNGTVAIWSVHLSTAISQDGWEWQKEMATVIAEEIGNEPGPMILLGDFNTTDQTENYRLIANRLNDVHWAVGRGFAFTFPDVRQTVDDTPVLGPVVRIDHIFASEHFTPQEIHVATSGYGSDHRPVDASLRSSSR